MDGQDTLLEREDGRYYAIDMMGTGLGCLSKTERIAKRLVSFGLPSPPALFLDLAHQQYVAIKDLDPLTLFDAHDTGTWPDDHGPLFDFFQKLIGHVINSATAIEAFANEAIPRDFKYRWTNRDGVASVLIKEEIERRLSTDDKLCTILPAALNVPSPKGKKVWERYVAIKRLRDRIIHVKSVDMKRSGPDVETLWGMLLRAHREPFCDYAYEIIGHFKPAIENRRWYGKYPYVR